MRSTTARFATTAVLLAGALAITACGQKREAEAEAGNATAEVTTTAPDTVISNTELNAAAVNAAGAADPTGAAANLTEGAGSTTAPN